MIYQKEIQFFWPLTEQMPLDLNYDECGKPKLEKVIDGTNGQVFTITNGGSWSTALVTSNLTVDIDTTIVKVKEKPNLCRRTILKCLGLKWEIK